MASAMNDSKAARFIGEPDTFPGSMPSNCIKTLERIRKTIKMTDGKAILMAITHLRGKATRWWEANEDNITNWDQFVKEFKKHYMPSESNNDELWDTMENYHQSEKQSVDDLILVLSELFSKLEITDERLHIRRFLRALHPSIAYEVESKGPFKTDRNSTPKIRQL
ncbi:unnamed protein product [Absidia cylindrospora]